MVTHSPRHIPLSVALKSLGIPGPADLVKSRQQDEGQRGMRYQLVVRLIIPAQERIIPAFKGTAQSRLPGELYLESWSAPWRGRVAPTESVVRVLVRWLETKKPG